MIINPHDTGILSLGITEVNSSWWLDRVNGANLFNRVYYFFNDGIECDVVSNSVKKNIVFRPGKLYILPANISIKFHLNPGVNVNHFFIDFVLIGHSFKPEIFEVNAIQNSCCKKLLEFFITYIVKNDINILTYYANKTQIDTRTKELFDVFQSTLALLLTFLNSEYNIFSTALSDFSAVIEYIQQNYDKKISLDELRKISSLSESQFIRQFKKILGTSPYHYIKTFKMHMALNMLNSGSSVSNVAYSLGFSSPSAFSNAFKKFFNYPPRNITND